MILLKQVTLPFEVAEQMSGACLVIFIIICFFGTTFISSYATSVWPYLKALGLLLAISCALAWYGQNYMFLAWIGSSIGSASSFAISYIISRREERKNSPDK